MTNRRSMGALLALVCCGFSLVCCSSANDSRAAGTGGHASGGAGASTGSVSASGGKQSSGGLASSGGTTGGLAGGSGIGLYSSVFEGGGVSAGGGGSVPVCQNPTPGTCEWSRLEAEGCCSQWSCDRVTRDDVFDTYPITACEALLTCVRAHPGCSSSTDPLCFQDENPNAPCLEQGYLASHQDPDGPFAWTSKLVQCVCGYPE